MFIIDGKVVSAELFTQRFVCNLSKCKGACCWEGDFGAPLSEEESELIQSLMPKVKEQLSESSVARISETGTSVFNKYLNSLTTPLHEDGRCVYLSKDRNGIARCTFEQLWEDGMIEFRKPVSCHLYPVRVTKNKESGFEALNYDEWEICKAACSLGEELRVPVFRFVKDAIIRQYGVSFYEQMEDIYDSFFAS